MLCMIVTVSWHSSHSHLTVTCKRFFFKKSSKSDKQLVKLKILRPFPNPRRYYTHTTIIIYSSVKV